MSEIDVMQAVRLAKDFARGIYENEKISRLGLEAVERTEDGKHWLITLGFLRPWSHQRFRKRDDFNALLEPKKSRNLALNREYKIFRLDAQSGEIVSVEMFSST
jgi:hypothetical protein